RAAGTKPSCAPGGGNEQSPPKPPNPKAKKESGAGSPDLLLAPTLADALKEATGGKGRVVSLSFKDRSAVLPAGKRPDACYWLEANVGQFVTSTYYRERLHSWVEDYNQSRAAEQWLGKERTNLRPDLDYEKNNRPHDI